jgi:hypothetical protein
MIVCYRCQGIITDENESVEHVIPNALGGKLKSKKLLCNVCNPFYGNTIDKELANSVKEMCNFLMIDRERGEPQRIKGETKSGESYFLSVGGTPTKVKPEIKETREGNQVNLKFTAGYEEQYRTIAKGFIRKYPQLTIEDFSNARNVEDVYMTEPLNFKLHIGGPAVFRAVTKIAVNLFILGGGDPEHILHLLPFLDGKLSESEAKNFVWLHYPEDPLHRYLEGEVSHVVQIIGNPEERLLYAFVELFNNQSFIIKLNDQYDGDRISESYAYDLLKRIEIPVNIQKQYGRTEFLNFFIVRDFVDKGPRPFQIAQERTQRVMNIAEKRLLSLQIRRIVAKVVNNAFVLYPDNELKRIEYMEMESEKEAVKFANSRIQSNLA